MVVQQKLIFILAFVYVGGAEFDVLALRLGALVPLGWVCLRLARPHLVVGEVHPKKARLGAFSPAFVEGLAL